MPIVAYYDVPSMLTLRKGFYFCIVNRDVLMCDFLTNMFTRKYVIAVSVPSNPLKHFAYSQWVHEPQCEIHFTSSLQCLLSVNSQVEDLSPLVPVSFMCHVLANTAT